MARSKSERKRARKEMVWARERQLARLGRLALMAASTAGAGLVTTAVLVLLGIADAAAWASGTTGMVILLATAFFAMSARTRMPPMSFVGWIGSACGVVAGGALVAVPGLFLAGLSETAVLVGGLSLAPTLVGIGLIGTELRRGPGNGDSMSASDSMANLADIA